jgi:hypothetical protein
MRRYQNSMRGVARNYKNKFVFAHIDGADARGPIARVPALTTRVGIKHEKYVSQFGLLPSVLPLFIVLDYANEQYYPPTEAHPVNSKECVRRARCATRRSPARGHVHRNTERFLNLVYEGKIAVCAAHSACGCDCRAAST